MNAWVSDKVNLLHQPLNVTPFDKTLDDDLPIGDSTHSPTMQVPHDDVAMPIDLACYEPKPATLISRRSPFDSSKTSN